MLNKQNKLRSILYTSVMSHTIRSDPFCYRRIHSHSSSSSSNGSVLRFRNRLNGLTLRGCFDSNHSSAAAAAGADNKAGALAPQRVRYLDIGFAGEGCTDARLVNGRGSNQRGNPLGFTHNPLPEKFVVAVDVDEVLGNFVSALNRFIADRYSMNHSVSEYHVYEFFKIWNCSRDEGIHPLPGAQMALHKLSRFCSLSVVTSRQNIIKDHTIEWLEKYYPGLFQEIHFGNHFALDGASKPKSEICRSLGAKVLIDDNPRYAIECAEVGIRVLLFDYENSYPWSKMQSADQHPLVTKVHNWEEVEQQLGSWVVS
ncbi:hypothetical protein EZV62_013114 [Acer yangbiense]|uniref:Uncharacterized protein n=1 Tax=Acer yangbiense TaxID=1000413 RepID=A0A5C7HX93_9ROSI|nr:hypothetical protein EZV62_013114 [Acer yangbiense]